MQSIMQWAKTWTRIDPNMGLTPIPSRSGLIYLTPSLYGTLLLVYFVLAILTILSPSEPIKCSKEAVCQLRPWSDQTHSLPYLSMPRISHIILVFNATRYTLHFFIDNNSVNVNGFSSTSSSSVIILHAPQSLLYRNCNCN